MRFEVVTTRTKSTICDRTADNYHAPVTYATFTEMDHEDRANRVAKALNMLVALRESPNPSKQEYKHWIDQIPNI